METVKEIFIKTIQSQPEDSTAEELLRELIQHQMILKSLNDVEENRVFSHEEIEQQVDSWLA